MRSSLAAVPGLLALLALLLACLPASAGTDAPAMADSLEERIWELRLRAGHGQAVALAERLLATREGCPGSKPYQIEDARRLVATLRHAAGLPPEDRRRLATADSLVSVDAAFYDQGRYAESQAVVERQLAIRRELLGEVHEDVASSMVELGGPLEAQGKLEAAASSYSEGLAMRREVLGENHPSVGVAMRRLGDCVETMGDYDAAEDLYRESIAIYRRTLGPEHPEIAHSLHNLGYVLESMGDLGEAVEHYRAALAMRLRLLGDDHEYVGLTSGNLAVVLMVLGRVDEAEPLMRRALAMSEGRLGREHDETARCYDHLGQILCRKGDFRGGEDLIRESLTISRETLGDTHRIVGIRINNLATAVDRLGRHGEAEALYREALPVALESYGGEHPTVAAIMYNLAKSLAAQGEYGEAEVLLREALEIDRRYPGSRVGEGTCLYGLAKVVRDRGDAEASEPIFREALAVYRSALGETHRHVALALQDLAVTLWAMGDVTQAEAAMAEAAAVHDVARLRVGSGVARSAFSESPYAKLAALRLSLGMEEAAWHPAEKYLSLALADLLRASDERELTPAEAAREDSLLGLLGDLERELAALAAAGDDSTGEAAGKADETRSRLLEAEADWSAFQKEIAEQHPVSEGEIFGLERVQSALAPGTAVIGWLDVEAAGRYHSWCYAIRDTGHVTWIPAGAAAATAGARDPSERSCSYRSDLSDATSPSIGVARESHALWQERVAPLLNALAGVSDLVVLPSGAMLGVPIGALVDADGVSVGQRFAISYAPSATIHTWLTEREEITRGGRSLLVGDPPFNDLHVVAMESEAGTLVAALPDEMMPSQELVRSALGGNTEALSSLPRLGGARREVDGIAAIAPEPSVLLGPEATEQGMVELAESGQLSEFGLIHIATHALVDDQQPERSALVLSQVGLPDAYECAVAGERIYDGLLSAKEIVRGWDLNADLVTLSACETGLGKEVAGEGYVGFAHAFLQAGARSLLVSLWKVEDRATALLMRRFYENWLGGRAGGGTGRVVEPMPKAEALQDAKRWLREYTDGSGERPYDHPYYWSAFVLIGDPE